MNSQDEHLRHALSLMETALELLDKSDASPEIGAHLDLAIHRLRETVDPGAQARNEGTNGA